MRHDAMTPGEVYSFVDTIPDGWRVIYMVLGERAWRGHLWIDILVLDDSFETNVGKTRDFQHGSALHRRSVRVG